MMRVYVYTREGRDLVRGGFELADSATVADLQKAIHRKTKKYYPARQRLTPFLDWLDPQVLNPKNRLKEYTELKIGEGNELSVEFKDLGPQVNYRTLFFWQYLGPLVLYPLFYYFPVYKIFGHKGERVIHPVQTYAMYFWCFHYFRRIMETFFVHRFSRATAPLLSLFQNCAYYWAFAAWISYYVNHPLYTPVSDLLMKPAFAFGALCQISNFYCHILLRNLRKSDGSGGYQIPRGFLFNIVTGANYTTEVFQWISFNAATQTFAGDTFVYVANSIMSRRAIAKHRRLKKLFNGKDGRPKYPRRWVVLPPLL